MDRLTAWRRLRELLGTYRPQLRFCLRMTVSGLLALALARSLTLPLHGIWVVLTAVVVTQMSVGGSLRATIEYVVGTFGGAVYAAIIGILVPHTSAAAIYGTLAITIAPLALAAAINPNFRVAPFSAVLVLLLAGQLGEGPIESAVIRLAEVALGGLVAIVVSLLVVPERAHNLGSEAAARILDRLADVLPELLEGFAHQLEIDKIRHIQNVIGTLVTAYQSIAAEARRERMITLATKPDPAPLSRTLLRLRHDFVMLGRAGAKPLPEPFAERLGPLIMQTGIEASDYLRHSAAALLDGKGPAPLSAFEAALTRYQAAFEEMRLDGVTLGYSSGEVEPLFALGFILEQLHSNFQDLARCVNEYAAGRRGKVA
jgi:uncharacterized membrane protein YccC